MKRDIIIISQFAQLPNVSGYGRFNFIVKKLLEQNEFSIELITSSFSHMEKEQKKMDVFTKVEDKFMYTIIHEPGYKKNISIKRIISHKILSYNLKKYLNKRKKPDLIYCAIPSLDVAKVSMEYAKKNNIKYIVDIQDLWPEAYKMIFNPPILGDILYKPLIKKADYVYSNADEIIAVSQTYVDRALHVNNNVKAGHCVYLGTDKELFDQFISTTKYSEKDGKFRIAYIGTLGSSYNIKLIIDCISALKEDYNVDLQFFIMGDGPLKKKLEKYAKFKNIDCIFTGFLNYDKMIKILTSCDFAVNPIIDGAAASIINKVGDYAAAGLPVINTQECIEYRNLIDKYNAGINCINDIKSVENALLKLIDHPNLRLEYGKNNRVLFEQKFDRNKTYNSIIEIIKKQ